jgi:protein LSM14
MAKLPPAPGQQQQQGGSDGVDNLTKKVNEMRTNDHKARASRQPHQAGHTAGFDPSQRGGRGRGGSRGGTHHQQQGRKVEVPKTDYDFQSANAKFNKQDLVKEAIATGSPASESAPAVTDGSQEASTTNGSAKDSSESATPTYNKSTSFFDNISSETKDRADPQGQRPGGREWRGEEVKRNFETFGQGSVDNGGYRGGFRGRGRGRGYRGRGGRGGRGVPAAGDGAPAAA